MTPRQTQFLNAAIGAGCLGFAFAVVFDFVPTFSKQPRTIAMACEKDFGAKSCTRNAEPPAFKPSALQ